MSNSKRPTPPEHLEGEALLEWHRVVGELEALGMLDTADRAILTLYVKTWAVYEANMRHVEKFGAVVKLPNGVVCGSPYYTVAQANLKQLHALLKDMGLTYTTRPRTKQPENEGLVI